MATSPMSKVVGHLRKMALLQECAGLRDEHLLEAFLAHRDEAAFEALLRRHGPMVLGICRRILPDHHDAEDAFQATFLVLVRKAVSIRKRELLANWLYGVAHRTALHARKATARRKAKERQVGSMTLEQSSQDEATHEMLPLLDQELSRLPDKYRVPIILCDLQGKTRRVAAQELKLPERTLSTRLARARVMLAKRLTRYGTGFSAGALTLAMSQNLASGSVPPSLAVSTVRIAILFVVGKTAVAGAIAAKVIGLTEGVVKTMLLSKLKTLFSGLLLGCVICAVVGHRVLGQPTFASNAQQNSQVTPAPKQPDKEARRTEKHSEYMELWADGIDYKNYTISGDEIATYNERTGISFRGRWSKLSVGSATKITIDGKNAKLDDLQSVTELYGRPEGTKVVFVEWTFEVVDNHSSEGLSAWIDPRGGKHPYRNGKVLRIDAKGRQVNCLVQAIDVKGRTITAASVSTDAVFGEVARQLGLKADYEVAKDVAVIIDGKPAKFADLKPNMLVSLQMSAVKERALGITASGPKVEGIVKSVSSDDRLIRVNIPTAHVTTAGIPVAKEAKVVIDGTPGTLSDVKAGMHVTLQMSADPDRSLVIGIGNSTKQ